MSAIEMMDPKMDAGMLCHQSHQVLGFEKSVDAGKLKIDDVAMDELIAIIDDTYACLVGNGVFCFCNFYFKDYDQLLWICNLKAYVMLTEDVFY